MTESIAQHGELLASLAKPSPPARLHPNSQPLQAVSGPYDPDPPSPEEVAEAARFHFGVSA